MRKDSDLAAQRLAGIIDNSAEAIITASMDGIITEWNAGAENVYGYTAKEAVGKPISLIAAEDMADEALGHLAKSAKVFLKDLDGRFQLVNKRYEEWYQRSQEEVSGTTVFDRIQDKYARNYTDADRETVESGSTVEFEFSAHVPPPDGPKRLLSVTKFPVKNLHGQIIGVGTIHVDVTDQRHTEEQLRQAQKMEAVGQLTGGIAQDFNNLLTVIQGNAELLVGGSEGDKEKAQSILRASRRGAELTHGLLAFSRQQALDPQTIEIADLMTGLSGLLTRTLGEDIELEFKPRPDLWLVTVNAGQLENALLNLAINARDAMSGGGKLTIECNNVHLDGTFAAQDNEAVTGDYVAVLVSDTGTGMSDDVLAHVFEPFFTTKEIGAGSGLGLSMVYGFAKQSGGFVNIYSEEGKGTSVKIYLPRGKSGEKPDILTAEDNVQRGRGETILVLEDNDDVSDLAVLMLNELGYRTVTVPTAKKAFDALANGEHVDLVLSDVVLLGGVSGPEFAEEARKDYPDLNVIFMSGYPAEATKRNGLMGRDSILINKPFRRNQLAEVIRSALDRETG